VSSKNQSAMGMVAALSAYCMWGFLPLYWKALDIIPSWEIICHRMIWSFAFTLGLLIIQGRLQPLIRTLANWQVVLTTCATSLLLAVNWLVYIWAVNNGNIVESSLGYFINPLIAVLLGVVILKEKLRIGQWGALLVALCGVLYLTFSYGKFPWIGMTLAITFALYSLLRKTAALASLEGLFCEFALLLLPASALLGYQAFCGQSGFLAHTQTVTLMLVGTGLITSLPLLLFVFGAKKISMTTIGLLQYLAPTIQFLLGFIIFKEPFPPAKLVGFSLIWLALIIFSVEGIARNMHQQHQKIS